jgi:hypothetical protein
VRSAAGVRDDTKPGTAAESHHREAESKRVATYNASIVESANATMTITAKSRTGMALHHLLAAARFAARIGVVERENVGQPFGDFWEEILQHALAVATLSVACVEGYAHELNFEQPELPPRRKTDATGVSDDSEDRDPILRRYAEIHALRTGERLDLGAAEVQGVDALIRLRNAVVHFKPEWFEEEERHAKLSGQLRYKFEGSPFLPGERLFPKAWASHSFAVWALRSTVGFLDHFYGQIRQPCPLAPFKVRLTTLSGGVV